MPRHSSNRSLTAIDLFSGCGGMTQGLKKAGFQVLAGVELDADSVKVYKANHPEVEVLQRDVCSISGTDILRAVKAKRIDLLAGCPPCQGFSSLTSKWHRYDRRNRLVGEMGRLIAELKPRAVMMENVPRLSQGRPTFRRFLRLLTKLGYQVRWGVLDAADLGVPQRRRRLVLLAGLDGPIELPTKTHSRTGERKTLPWSTVEQCLQRVTLGRAVIWDLAVRKGGPATVKWHVVRRISEKNRSRLRYAKAGARWTKIPKRLRPTCHDERSAGFPNVYGRMSWDRPSPTITGGCTTLSMGRFGHPELARTISVREAALLQTFPKDYKFPCQKIGKVSEMVGNALPCKFAQVVARMCLQALKARET